MQNYDNKLKHFIAGQVPEFVSEQHPMFVAFLEAYFEWLQMYEEGRRISPLTLLDQRNIDESLNSFISLFREEYLKNFPQELAFDKNTGSILDERKLMKHIRAFYKAKGTEKAYRFLFLILYNTYSEIYYPKTDILRVSDGKWNTLFKLKTTSSNGQKIFDYIGGTLSQRDGNGILTAYTTIKGIIQYSQGGYEVTEYTITPPFGNFLSNFPVQISSLGKIPITEKIYTVLTGFKICNQCSLIGTEEGKCKLYKIGDKVILYPKYNFGVPEGVGGFGQVSEIDYLQSPFFVKTGESDARGPIKKFKVVDGGVNYNPGDWQAEIQSVNGRGTIIAPTFGAVIEDYGFYSNDDGQISSKKKLQDNRIYQDFSYVIKTDESFNRWIDTLKKLIHPAGMAVFAQQYLYRASGYRVDDKLFLSTFEDPVIGHYTPYRFKTYENLRMNSRGVDLYPNGYNPMSGTVPEHGTETHDTNGNPLSEGIKLGINNIWCISRDHSTDDATKIYTNNLYDGLTGTEELQAKHEIWNGCTGSENGCCISAPYWIIYSHPNSRGYSQIPPYTCEIENDQTVSKLNRFSCIKLYDFFHMEDANSSYVFEPTVDKFSEFAIDDFVTAETVYDSGSVTPLEVEQVFNPLSQGQAKNAIFVPSTSTERAIVRPKRNTLS